MSRINFITDDEASGDEHYISELAQDFEDRLYRTKATKKSGGGARRVKYSRRVTTTKEEDQERSDKRCKKREVQRRERKRLIRNEIRMDQMEARREKSSCVHDWEAVCIQRYSRRQDDYYDDEYGMFYDGQPRLGTDIVSAKELGVDKTAHDRLLQLLRGDDITPEDYDLLLQLDNNNTKAILTAEKVNEYDIVRVNDETRQEHSLNETSCCLVCMQSFDEVSDGFEIRRLPCGHMFCKECIDHWLTTKSTKCPDLSCFWNPED